MARDGATRRRRPVPRSCRHQRDPSTRWRAVPVPRSHALRCARGLRLGVLPSSSGAIVLSCRRRSCRSHPALWCFTAGMTAWSGSRGRQKVPARPRVATRPGSCTITEHGEQERTGMRDFWLKQRTRSALVLALLVVCVLALAGGGLHSSLWCTRHPATIDAAGSETRDLRHQRRRHLERAPLWKRIGMHRGTRPTRPGTPRRRGYLVLTFDFRGYGASGGSKDFQYLDRDMFAAVHSSTKRARPMWFLSEPPWAGRPLWPPRANRSPASCRPPRFRPSRYRGGSDDLVRAGGLQGSVRGAPIPKIYDPFSSSRPRTT